MKISLEEMSEQEIKDNLKLFIELHTSLTQQVYKLKERIHLFQRALHQKQRTRIMKANALKLNEVDTSKLEEATGLSRENLLRGMGILLMTENAKKSVWDGDV